MKYLKLGKLPKETIDFFLTEILKRKQPDISYQWIHFDEYLNNEFLKLFTNTELKIQCSETRRVQKAFYSDPGHGYRIHKDGFNCRSALNIVVSCNTDDWVRWYDEDYINSISATHRNNTSEAHRLSRNTDLHEYADIPFVDEMRQNIGDVYLVNTDVYHSFKCSGPNNRIIIQTKLDGNPTISEVYENLKYYFK